MKIAWLCLWVLGVSGALAESSSSPLPACTAAEFRQFDFWLGSWTVRNPDGVAVGSSEIERAAEGCAVREEWTSARDIRGMSLNFYDAQSKQWQQHWVGGDGQILALRGGIAERAMVLADPNNRITWTPLPDGKVKQEWSSSSDGGQTWKTSFIGIYEKR